MKPGNCIALSTKMAQENWENVFYVQDIDGKVEIFNDIVMNILNKTMPERNVRFHPSEKPWMTRHIKTQIKARQRPFSRRDKTNYDYLCKKVSTLVSKAKGVYYQNKTKDYRKSKTEKWFKSIFSLAGDNGTQASLTTNLTNNHLSDLVQKLQAAFTKPWENMETENAARLPIHAI